MKKLGIVVPVFNAEPYLNNLFSDISKNEYEDIEIVFVIDGSTDSSLEICLEYQKLDKRCKVIACDKHQGVSFARNQGIKILLQDVEYIGFIDADDRISSKYFSQFAKAITTHPESDIIIGEIECKVSDKSFFPFKSGEFTKEVNLISSFLQLSFSSAVWGRFYKREAIEGLSFENISILEDFWFNWRVISNISNLSVVDGPRYSYIIRNTSSLSKQFSTDCLSIISFGNEIMNELYAKDDSNLIECGKSFIAALLVHILNMYLVAPVNKEINNQIDKLLKYADKYKNVVIGNYLVVSDSSLSLSELIEKSRQKMRDFILIGIGGRGATGKSFLGKYLLKNLGPSCQYIEVDKVIEKEVLPSENIVDKARIQFNQAISIDDIIGSYFRLDEKSRILHEFFCDYVNRAVTNQIDTTKNIVIVDWFLYHELDLFRRSDFSIFLDAPEQMRFERCRLRGSDLEMFKKVDFAYKLPETNRPYTITYNADKTDVETICSDINTFLAKRTLL